jgi:hypothetical protein
MMRYALARQALGALVGRESAIPRMWSSVALK